MFPSMTSMSLPGFPTNLGRRFPWKPRPHQVCPWLRKTPSPSQMEFLLLGIGKKCQSVCWSHKRPRSIAKIRLHLTFIRRVLIKHRLALHQRPRFLHQWMRHPMSSSLMSRVTYISCTMKHRHHLLFFLLSMRKQTTFVKGIKPLPGV